MPSHLIIKEHIAQIKLANADTIQIAQMTNIAKMEIASADIIQIAQIAANIVKMEIASVGMTHIAHDKSKDEIEKLKYINLF